MNLLDEPYALPWCFLVFIDSMIYLLFCTSFHKILKFTLHPQSQFFVFLFHFLKFPCPRLLPLYMGFKLVPKYKPGGDFFSSPLMPYSQAHVFMMGPHRATHVDSPFYTPLQLKCLSQWRKISISINMIRILCLVIKTQRAKSIFESPMNQKA